MAFVAAYLLSSLVSCLRNEPKTMRQIWVRVKGIWCCIKRCLDLPSIAGTSRSILLSSFSGFPSSLGTCSTLSFPLFVTFLPPVPPDVLSISVLFTCCTKCSTQMQHMLQNAGRTDMERRCRVESSRSAACIPNPCLALSPSRLGEFGEKILISDTNFGSNAQLILSVFSDGFQILASLLFQVCLIGSKFFNILQFFFMTIFSQLFH